jgi:hypothetical protein
LLLALGRIGISSNSLQHFLVTSLVSKAPVS